MNNKQWKQQFRDILFHTPVKYLELEDFISTLLNEKEAEIRKETIEAVLPCKVKTTRGKESKYFKEYGFDRNNFATGHNHCRQQIIDSAKKKFNINLE